MHKVSRTLSPALAMLAVACASYGRPLVEIAEEINATLYVGPTLIEPGDVVDLRFARMAEWNQIAQVRPDGCVSLPLLGELRVAGNSVAQLEAALGQKYQAFIDEPDLAVNLGERTQEGSQTSNGVVVSGEVTRPGLVGMSGERLTLLDALGRAGGHLKATALLGNTLMMRRSPTTGLYRSWRIDAREVHWDASQPIYLQRHDLIIVPNTPIDNANIWVDQYINKMIPMGVAAFALGIVVGNG